MVIIPGSQHLSGNIPVYDYRVVREVRGELFSCQAFATTLKTARSDPGKDRYLRSRSQSVTLGLVTSFGAYTGSTLKSLAGALPGEKVRSTLSVDPEVETEIPAKGNTDDIATGPFRELACFCALLLGRGCWGSRSAGPRRKACNGDAVSSPSSVGGAALRPF